MAEHATQSLRVPAEFWSRPPVRNALRNRDIAALFHLLKRYAGASQTRIGAAVGLEQGYVSKIMTGRRLITAIDVLERIADGCAMPDQSRMLLGLAPLSRRSRESSTTGQHDGRADLGSRHERSDYAPEAPDVVAMRAFRGADKRVGGGHLYDTVVRYLNAEVAPRLVGSDCKHEGPEVFTAAAALSEMAGWMAHDSGRQQRAQAHFRRALDLARLGGDRQLLAHIYASGSHLAAHLHQPVKAVRFAEAGQSALRRGPSQPELESRLLAMQARGFAALGHDRDCVRLLARAEAALRIARPPDRSPWISVFDEGSLASEAARCMRLLGDLSEARHQAERVIELRPAERVRSRAFGQLLLATVLIAQGKPDEACVVAGDVLLGTHSLGSYLVAQQLLELKRFLMPYRASNTVACFVGHLDEVLHERSWLRKLAGVDGRH